MGTWAMMLGRGLDEVIPRSSGFRFGVGTLWPIRRSGNREAMGQFDSLRAPGWTPWGAISVALTVGATGVLAGALLAFLTGTICRSWR